MPEGDSVFRLANRLRRALDGHDLIGGELRLGSAAGTRLDGWRITSHDTHGKHLLTRFDNDLTLHTHLRMQGSWTVTSPGKTLPRRLHPDVRVRMVTSNGSTAWALSLPVVELLPACEEATVIGHLGPDPLRQDWDAEAAMRRLSSRPDDPLIAALLNQSLMAGLGNMWANEVCFLRGIFPWTPVRDVDVTTVVATAARGLRASVTVPGLFQTTTGNTQRGERHFVVGRAGRPCLRCRTLIRVRGEVTNDAAQRRTWWCPNCQPASK